MEFDCTKSMIWNDVEGWEKKVCVEFFNYCKWPDANDPGVQPIEVTFEFCSLPNRNCW